jgi:hypothetical protein
MLTMSSVERMGFVSQRQATTDIDYNLEYPPLAYNNATIHRIQVWQGRFMGQVSI